MAPSSSQKGTGKKGGASAIRQQQQQQQQQRSRNTTPGPAAPVAIASLPPFETVETETIELRFDVFRNLAFEDMVDPPASGTLIPDSKNLDGILTRLQRLGDVIEKRGLCCDRGMRLLAQNRKQRMDELALERGREEERRQREADGEERERKSNKKKRKGADTLAPHGGKIGQSCLSSPVCFFCKLGLPCSSMRQAASLFVGKSRRAIRPDVTSGWLLVLCHTYHASHTDHAHAHFENPAATNHHVANPPLTFCHSRALVPSSRIDRQSPETLSRQRFRELVALPRCAADAEQHGRRRQSQDGAERRRVEF